MPSSSSTSTSIPRQQRPLRLTLIPEEGSIEVNSPARKNPMIVDQNIGTGRTLLEGIDSTPSSRLSTQRDQGDAYANKPWMAPSVQVRIHCSHQLLSR